MMITNCDLIIKNGKVFEKNRFKKNHIVIKDGKIFKLTKNIKSFKSKKIINADKKIVIPEAVNKLLFLKNMNVPTWFIMIFVR